MTNEEAFVKELIAYIFYVQDEDDDNISAEIMCRKLHKYELIDKGENGWKPKEELDCRLCKNWDFDVFGHWRCTLAQDDPHWSCDFELKPDIRKMPPADGSVIPKSYLGTTVTCPYDAAMDVKLTTNNAQGSDSIDCGWK